MAARSLFSWLRSARHGRNPVSRVVAPTRRSARRTLLGVEALEDRSVPATFTVNTLVDENDGIAVGGVSLREAIAEANGNGTGLDTIDFDVSVTGTINLTGALPTLNTDLTIDGPGANLLTVRRDTGGDYRLFEVAAGRTITLQDLTLANGGGHINGGGGAILTSGTLTVANCALVNNVDSSAVLFGGGAINSAGGLTVRNCTFSGNSSNWVGGAVYSSATTVITNSTFSGSTAILNGGAVKLVGPDSFSLVNNTFSGNTGGGVFFSNAT